MYRCYDFDGNPYGIEYLEVIGCNPMIGISYDVLKSLPEKTRESIEYAYENRRYYDIEKLAEEGITENVIAEVADFINLEYSALKKLPENEKESVCGVYCMYKNKIPPEKLVTKLKNMMFETADEMVTYYLVASLCDEDVRSNRETILKKQPDRIFDDATDMLGQF